MRIYLVGATANIDRCARVCDAAGVPITYVACRMPSQGTMRRLTVPCDCAETYPTGPKVLALSPAGTVDIRVVDWCEVEVLLFGNERTGLPVEALESCRTVRIPMVGAWHSHTIEVALTIAL